jgi:hypothetical protein
MAKSYEHAGLICIILSIIAAAGCAIGIFVLKPDAAGIQKSAPLVVIVAMLPAVIYEVYRTEGFSTKLASIGILAILVLELLLISGKININLGKYLGEIHKSLAGVDAKMAGPAVIAVLSFILIRQTSGVYTRWLAFIILIASIVLFYVFDPIFFKNMLKIGIDQGAKSAKEKLK